MSVVNKMLQDLEQRQERDGAASSDYQPARKRNIPVWSWVTLLLLVILLLVWWLTASTKPIEQSIDQLAPTTVASNQNSSQNNSRAASEPRPMLTAKTATEQSAPAVSESDIKSEQSATVVVEQADIQVPAEAESEDNAHVSSMRVSSKNTLTIRDPRADAQFALQQGDTQAAIKALFALLQEEPENINARKKLTSLLFADGNESGAETLLNKGLELHPNSADLRLMMARLYVQRQQEFAALELLQQVNVYALNDPEYVSYRASLAKQLKQHSAAYADYLQLAKAQPQQAKWWLGFAIAAERMAENPSAVAAYERALSLDQLSGEVSEFMRQRIRYLRAQS